MDNRESGITIYDFHRVSARHVLTVETDMLEPDAKKIFAISDKIRKAGNELVALMRNNFHQLMRTKRYRRLLKLYGNTKDKKQQEKYKRQLKRMHAEYNVTWNFCRQSMQYIATKYGIHSVFGWTKAESVWQGMEKCLYSNGKDIRFKKFGDYPCVKAKQIERAIIFPKSGESFIFTIGNVNFGIKIKDKFQEDEVDAIRHYLNNAKNIDETAIKHYIETGECINTYRPCYAMLVPKKIRGKYRVFLQICIEGKPKPKFDKYGKPRHQYGKGKIGADIGTQTVAYTSETEVGLKNLAERGKRSIKTSERKERLLLRAMDRSRRATNPQNYNEDGTIKKGRKKWQKSKHYKKLQYKHAELCRKNAESRRLAINEEVNHLRSVGDVFVTEPKNAGKLAKRAKKTTKNKNGKFNRKKRFGKSIKNRCPGYFQAKAKQVFESTGGAYIEVPKDYRASQYDHTIDDYVKKKLSQRMFTLAKGVRVQRDWYSSFLLYCCEILSLTIDKAKCKREFPKHLAREKALITWIKANRIKVMNSGIKIR